MNVKIWQLIAFSLVPLALVFLGVIIGSLRGIDAEKEQFEPGGYFAPAAPAAPSYLVLQHPPAAV